jgi:imidazolonepropionase-like amidohydrolase
MQISSARFVVAVAALILSLAHVASAGYAQSGTSASPILAITDVAVVDVETESVYPGRTVIVAGDRITAIGPADSVAVPTGARRLDGEGQFLIPGLWDMHVHLDDPEMWARHPTPDAKERLLKLLVAHGVTGVRDMGSGLDQIERWRARWRTGALVAPRIVTSGPIIGGSPPAMPFIQVTVGNEREARAVVRQLSRRPGVDFLKPYALVPREAYLAMTDEAQRLGMEVSGHLPFGVSIEEAVRAGQRTFEHGDGLTYRCTPTADSLHREVEAARALDPFSPEAFRAAQVFQGVHPEVMARFDPAHCQELLEELAQAPMWVTPTNAVFRGLWLATDTTYADPRTELLPEMYRKHWREARTPPAQAAAQQKAALQSRLALIGALHDAGVGLLAASDMAALPYTYPGSSLHDELVLMVEAGLSPAEALATATVEPARYLGRAYEMGTVAAGNVADLVLLQGNPLTDIEQVRNIAAVIAGGTLLDRADLDGVLDAARNGAP